METAKDLFQLRPELGGGATIGAMENVEDYFEAVLIPVGTKIKEWPKRPSESKRTFFHTVFLRAIISSINPLNTYVEVVLVWLAFLCIGTLLIFG